MFCTTCPSLFLNLCSELLFFISSKISTWHSFLDHLFKKREGQTPSTPLPSAWGRSLELPAFSHFPADLLVLTTKILPLLPPSRVLSPSKLCRFHQCTNKRICFFNWKNLQLPFSNVSSLIVLIFHSRIDSGTFQCAFRTFLFIFLILYFSIYELHKFFSVVF